MTNGDKIRSMNDEELTSFLYEWRIQNISEYLKNPFEAHPVDIKKCIMEAVNEDRNS